MNPDNPPLPPEEFEVRFTALVLGETTVGTVDPNMAMGG